MVKKKKVCGNCQAIQPKTKEHILCCCEGARHCGCMMSVRHGGCEHWKGEDNAEK